MEKTGQSNFNNDFCYINVEEFLGGRARKRTNFGKNADTILIDINSVLFNQHRKY